MANQFGCGLLTPPVVMTTKEMLADRPDWCPLISIQPHSRLIQECDVFCVLERMIGYLDEDMIERLKLLIRVQIPTVIEAEEGT